MQSNASTLLVMTFFTAVIFDQMPAPVMAEDSPVRPLFGSADWKASPTDPVGFCGQANNNWYPGANPPLEWWDGTPAKVKTRRAVPFYPGEFGAEFEADGFADSKSKNILWKSPVPGWADSLPLAVGKRVITLSSPHYVTCWDADTGKVLWQDELKLMVLPVLSADRKSVGTAPDPAQAVVAQNLFERVLGYTHVRLAATAFQRDFKDRTKWRWTARAPLLQHAISVLEQWKTELKSSYPDIGPSLEAEQALLRDCLAGKTQEERQASGLPGQKSFGGGYAGSAPPVYAKEPDLQTYTMKRLGLSAGHFVNGWGAWCSDTMSTPVSDGEVVCVMFGHGQIAAYDLASGKRLWAWRDPLMNASSVSHLPSPMIWRDLMIFKAAGRDTGKPPAYSHTMMAVDKRTGAIRWEVGSGQGGCVWGGSHGDHMSPLLLKMGDRAVVVSNLGLVLDAETGATLAQLPNVAGSGKNKGHWQTGHMLSIGDRLLRGAGSDGGPTPISVWPMRFAGGKLVVDEGYVLPARSDQGSFSANNRIAVVGSTVFDWSSGKRRAQLPREVSVDTTLAGNVLISPQGHSDVEMRREDLLSIANFSVVDVTDPSAPRHLSNRSRLGGPQTPADIADKYFPEFRKPELKRFGLGGYLGIGAYFGHRVGGLTAHGNRLYIRSQTHLYCIGPAVLGAGADDPQVVAAIRAGKDVAKYLDSDSAQYRYEALRRFVKAEAGNLKPETQKVIENLAKTDQYEEIRADALRALGLATNQSGFAVLKQAITNEIVAHHESHTHQGLGDAVHTLRALGRDADPTLVALLGEKDLKLRRTGAAAAGLWPSGGEALRDALVACMTNAAPEYAPAGQAAAYALQNWPVDPRVTEAFTSLINDAQKGWGKQGPAFAYLYRYMADDRKNAFLGEVAAKNPDQATWSRAVDELVERRAFNVLGPAIEATTGRRQGGLFWPLCQVAKSPEAKKFAVEQMKKKLEAKANPDELNINALPMLGADAGPLLPLLKALNSTNPGTVNAIAQIEAAVATEGKK